ncbi:MAG: HlyD family efflux transporter periplasmic adaptor subunit, partial [Planctomycetota bacterium]
ILFLPIPKQVACAFQLVPRDAANVMIPDPGGKLATLSIKPGMQVNQGDLLAELKNVDLDLELMDIEGQKLALEKEIYMLKKDGDPYGQVAAMQVQLEAQTKVYESELKKKTSLQISAPASGTIMSPPLRPDKMPPKGQLRQWSGSPMDERNNGLHLQTGDMLCTIGTPGEYEAELAVDQVDINFIKEGMKVKMVLDSITFEQLEGTIDEISMRDMQVAPRSLGNQAGGTLATRTDASGVERPASATYKVSVHIDDDRGFYRTAYRGQARIKAGTQTIGSSLWQYITRTFHFYM